MKKIVFALTTAVILVTASAALANPANNESEVQILKKDAVKFKVSTGFDYSTGDYGNSKNTEIWYVPVSGKVEYHNVAFKVTAPWLSIKGPGAVIGGGGGVVTGGNNTVTTESGLGDVVTSLTYTLDLPSNTYIDFTGKVKLPTADEDKGLGTGEFDYTFQTEATKKFGALMVFANGGYKIVGSSATLRLRNVWLAGGGVGYDFTPKLSAGFSYDWRQSASRGAENPSEISPYVNYKVNKKVNVQVYGLAGFSDGSPDAGGGMTVGYKY